MGTSDVKAIRDGPNVGTSDVKAIRDRTWVRVTGILYE